MEEQNRVIAAYRAEMQRLAHRDRSSHPNGVALTTPATAAPRGVRSATAVHRRWFLLLAAGILAASLLHGFGTMPRLLSSRVPQPQPEEEQSHRPAIRGGGGGESVRQNQQQSQQSQPEQSQRQPVKVWVYPSAELDAAVERAAAARKVVCGGHYFEGKLADARGHLAYGRRAAASGGPASGIGGDGAFGRLPLYVTGKNCQLEALVAALRPGSPYRAASPDDADVFVYFPRLYIPLLVDNYTQADYQFLKRAPRGGEGLTAHQRLRMRKNCEFLWGLDVPTARRLMPHLTVRNFRRHFILASDQVQACAHEGTLSPPLRREWTTTKAPYFARLLTYTTDPESTDASWSNKRINVPYTGLLHHPIDPETLINHRRKHYISFIGSTMGTPENGALRGLLKAACENTADDGGRTCLVVPPQDTATQNLLYKWHSTFCLMPGGFGVVRRSAVDALAVGCIPVFFMRRKNEFDSLWPYHIGDWRHKAMINVDIWAQVSNSLAQIIYPPGLVPGLPAGAAESLQQAATSGARSAKWIIDLLRAIPADKVAALQRSVAENAHALVYGMGDGSAPADDAVGRTLQGLRDIARRRAVRDAGDLRDVRRRVRTRLTKKLGGGAAANATTLSDEAWLHELAHSPAGLSLLDCPAPPYSDAEFGCWATIVDNFNPLHDHTLAHQVGCWNRTNSSCHKI